MERLLLLLLLLLPIGANADYPLEIIELKGRGLEEVLPLVRPFLDRDGAVSGMNNQLVIRTSPQNLREIKTLLKEIDQPPRRLLISVRQRTSIEKSRHSIGLDAYTRLGDRTRVTQGSPIQENGFRLQGLQGSTGRNAENTSQIQTVEGHPAFISVGQSLPVSVGQRVADGDLRYYRNTTRYRDASTGFYALPRVNGKRVTVDISPFMTRPANGRFDIANASTRVSGQLGEWIEFGQVSQHRGGSGKRIGLHAGTEGDEIHGYSIMVEALH